MEGDLGTLWKIVGAIGGIFGVLNIAFIKPMRDRLVSLENRMGDRYTKEETKEAIEIRQEAIRNEIKHLTEGVNSLNDSIKILYSSVQSLQMKQQHSIGIEEGRR